MKLRTYVTIIAFVLFCGFWFLALTGRLPVPRYQPTDQCAQQQCHHYAPLADFWTWITHDSISFFTVILAAFTGLLAWVAYKQIKLARDEFISTHRPRIIVRNLHLLELTSGVPLKITFSGINAGETTARIKAIYATAFSVADQPPRFVDSAMEIPVGRPELKSAQGDHWTVRPIFSINQDELIEIITDKRKLYCVGLIRYEDENGTSRQTGFCREYLHKTERFIRTDDPDYEYEY